ncbi:2,3-bisphosphoglycerate-dependent phosphoglycerate mutase, partial [Brevundimonas sp. UBA7534]|uniref:2,3-bisphosphoglycerate-dependent phosphoglycerate mutase n=1 Tax=Brevundimonas sp. UBA7534 TaxID=1946138 RepID=UPI0025C4B2A8
NERHYGALQGKDKAQVKEEFGEEQFMVWRRSFDTPPPALDDDSEFSQVGDERYADLGKDAPRTEALKQVVDRLLPYWEEQVLPDLKAGKTVLIAAHGNSLRALVKHLDGISDEDIAGLNIPTGIPLVYELDQNFKPITANGRYLDPEAAAAGAAAVAAHALADAGGRFDAVLLGMGEDGHICSMFPESPTLKTLLTPTLKPTVLGVPHGRDGLAPPQERLSINLSYLMSAGRVILGLKGATKRAVFEEQAKGDPKVQPIAALLANAVPLEVLWTEEG